MTHIRPDPFGVYVHWPFCLSKCPYCDFNSHVRAAIDADAWAAALVREIETARAAMGAEGRVVSSIFFGGGTPSLMPGKVVAAALNAIAKAWGLAPDCEVTLEANPTSAEASRFRDYRGAGVNRVSLGVQSLRAEALSFLGRKHTAEEALNAVTLARSIFPRASFDLIYARPDQSADDWEQELSQALAYGPDHLSLYQLTFEEGTQFELLRQAGRITPLDPVLAATLYENTQAQMDMAGLPAYEVSNHAKPGQESRHNLLYWRYGEYLGIGPGAHGRVRIAGEWRAETRVRAPEAWLSAVKQTGSGLETAQPLTDRERGTEALLMGLRLAEGVGRARIESLLGQPLNQTALTDLTAQGFLTERQNQLTATRSGIAVLNTLLAQLLP